MATTPSYGYSAARQTTRAPVYVDPTVRRRQQSDSLFQAPLIAPTTAPAPRIQAAPVQRQATRTPAPVTAQQPAMHAPVSAASQQAALPMFDYTTDPILQQIQGLGTMNRGDADAGALGVKKQIAVQYGDEALGHQLGDTNTAQAAAQNPYSAFARLRQTNDQNVRASDEADNANNLFYSGARILHQQDLANQYGRAQADTTANEQSALGQTEQQRLAAYLAADQADQQAKSDAANRALQLALAYPPAPAPGAPGGINDPLGGGAGGIVGPGPVAAPHNPIEDGPPTLPPLSGAFGNGTPVPMSNYSAGLGSGGGNAASAILQILASGGGGGDLSAAFAPPAPPKKKQHSYAGRAL